MNRLCLILIVCLLSVYFCQARNPMKLIIDTDAGSDDAVALFLALAASEKLQVIAITCSYGNTDVENVVINVRKILTVANRTNIPIYKGATKPLIQNYTSDDYFGKDGLGDFEFNREIVATVDRSKHASIAMIELIKKYPGEVSIMTLGPLTNVALAATLDPNFTANVSRFYVMGSAIDDPKEPSEPPSMEFNFSLDPESNAIFLNSTTRIKTVITPWNVVLKNNISKEWRKEILGKVNSESISFLNKAEHIVLEKLNEWLPADSIAVATMIWPKLITSSVEVRMTSVTCGPYRGSVVVQSDGLSSEKNVDIIRDFNVSDFKNFLLQLLARI